MIDVAPGRSLAPDNVMMRASAILSVAAALVFVGAMILAPVSRRSTVTEASSLPARDGGLPPADLDFMKRTAEWARQEREIASLVQGRSSDSRTQALVQRVDDEVRGLEARVDGLADKWHVDLNDGLGADALTDSARRTRNALEAISGPTLDRAWVEHAAGSFHKALAEHRRGAESRIVELRQYAIDALPVLEARAAELDRSR
jgi:hypothetical protein